MTPKASRGGPGIEFLGVLRPVALIAALVGAGCSAGLMLYVGHRNSSRILLALFAVWVLSPFVALASANMLSRRWPILTRVAIYGLTLVLTLGSLAIYGDVALRPRAKPASVFLMVPLASWLLIAILVPAAMLISGRIFRR